jgi:hypothetical protein
VALQGLNLAELSPTEPWRRWDLVLANLDFQRAAEQCRNAVASQLGNSTIEGGGGALMLLQPKLGVGRHQGALAVLLDQVEGCGLLHGSLASATTHEEDSGTILKVWEGGGGSPEGFI